MEAKMATYGHARTIAEAFDQDDNTWGGKEVEHLVKLYHLALSLSSLYPVLPKGVFSTAFVSGILPRYGLSDAVNTVINLESPWFIVVAYHLCYPEGYDGREGCGRMRGEIGEQAVKDFLCESGLSDQKLIVEDHAENTPWQTNWLAKVMKDNNIEAIVIKAASGHITRVFATLLQSLKKINHQALVIPVPHAMNPAMTFTPNMSQRPEDDIGNEFSQIDFCSGEATKILTYKDVIDPEGLSRYTEYLAGHPLLSEFRLDQKPV